MGACVSNSRSPPPPPAAPTAKVVSPDGSMAQFAAPVTAREAMTMLASGGRRRDEASSSSAAAWFVCSSDELRFDAPARALAAEEPLRPGQLYFTLPAPMLCRPLSGQEMAALAVKAATALAVEAGLFGAAGMSPRRPRKDGGGGGAAGKRRQTARVAPLPAAASGGKAGQSEGATRNLDANGAFSAAAYDGDRTVGKTRHRAGRRSAARRRAAVQRLSAIAEDSE
ncbi:hypothetical protein ACP4OV_025410 [Aristida adscensionis]